MLITLLVAVLADSSLHRSDLEVPRLELEVTLAAQDEGHGLPQPSGLEDRERFLQGQPSNSFWGVLIARAPGVGIAGRGRKRETE